MRNTAARLPDWRGANTTPLPATEPESNRPLGSGQGAPPAQETVVSWKSAASRPLIDMPTMLIGRATSSATAAMAVGAPNWLSGQFSSLGVAAAAPVAGSPI